MIIERFSSCQSRSKMVPWVCVVAVCEMNVKIWSIPTAQCIGTVYAFDLLFRTSYFCIHHCFIEENKIFLHLLLTASLDNSLSDVYRSPPRPLPYDADPRYFRLQRDGLVSRQEKGSGHSHEETEPLQRSDIDDDSEYLSRGNKWNVSKSEVESKENDCKFSVKMSTAKTTAGFANIYSSSEDEDVCPTCLEARPAIYSRRPKNNDKMLSPLPPGLHI